MFMIRFLFCLFMLMCPIKGFTQSEYVVYNTAYDNYVLLLNEFLKDPTNTYTNESLYEMFEYLQQEIEKVHVTKGERYKLNFLVKDIYVIKAFISPISNKYNAHLSESDIIRLQNIFGEEFSKVRLNVKCQSDEIEFIEIKLMGLRICYFHNISKYGLRIKYYATSGNITSSGEYGAMRNEYTPILHNAGNKYPRIISATIVDRF